MTIHQRNVAFLLGELLTLDILNLAVSKYVEEDIGLFWV
jgi:hypothetical protein